MKEICIITNYFPPETGAASNRIFQLAEGLKSKGFETTVICPLPNYPTGKIFAEYKGKLRHLEDMNGIKVYRLWIFASNSKNKFLRLLAMLSYSLSLTWFFIWNKIPKTVIVQSPPLLVAFTSMFFLKSRKRKLILNVSDLWPLAGLELGAFKKNLNYRILERIEKHNYQKAHLILGQSEEILCHIKKICPEKELFLYRNYPNFKSPYLPEAILKEGRKIKLVYAGLLGIAQGILKLCNNLDYSKIEFHVYGSGAEEDLIKSFIKENNHLPIFFHGSLSREKLHKELLEYDLTIIPLLNRIYGSVPSKIFEYAKLGLPMLYFGGGEGETIIEKNSLGWVVEPGNYELLNDIINNIQQDELTLVTRKNIQMKSEAVFDYEMQLNELAEII
ncbi:glycosyltransferase family 4 protein [Mangrovimonas sp. AS39]|uniref:glycosyltransferase family 4 protein n=1 Tax=Mangrovimonas futianensis TaxID=2895523 RepID=UPI001E427A8B|nr:glycosyltransferase family 4 protein [Mangrovimonas futianensis]MCF1193936.1 glycosyltransferase family 4 protein [Mangrovimonas futianensis]